MSYANLISQICTDNADEFKRIRDFVCKRNGSYDYSTTGIGWTLHDAVYATDQDSVSFGDYFVAYSPGEDGDQDIYVKITYLSGYISVHAYLYWNNSTHSGVQAATTTNNFTATNSLTATLWVYGDLDCLVFVAKYGTVYYAVSAGHFPDSQFATSVATSAYSVSSGSSVVISVDTVPTGFSVGRKIYIRDNAAVEICEITDISGTDITVDSLSNSYSAGCKLQGEVSTYCSCSINIFSNIYPVISHAGTSSLTHTLDGSSGVSSTTDDGLLGGSVLSSLYFSAASSFMGPVKNAFFVSSSGRTSEQTETDNNGITYRFFSCYSAKNMLVKEV